MHWLGVLLAVFGAVAQSNDSIERQRQSIERQREAIRKQVAGARLAAAGSADVTGIPECDPLPPDTVSPMIERAAKDAQLPQKLIRAVVAQESGFRPCALSNKGAQGLMQLMPETAEELDVEDPFDAAANLAAGAKFLRQLLEKFKGDLSLSLAAYNAGPAAVEEAHGMPDIPETRAYVDAIVKEMGVKQIDLPSIPTPKPTGN